MSVVKTAYCGRFVDLGYTVLASVLATPSAACECSAHELDRYVTRGELIGLLDTDRVLSKSVCIGRRRSLAMIFEGTSKGNGTLRLANLHLRIVDQHDDGAVYENSILRVAFEDSNADGYCDLVVSGTVRLTGEKESDPVSSAPLRVEYRYAPESGTFVEVSRNSPVEIDLSRR